MINFWKSWAPASCMPNNCFCEYVRVEEFIRQPSNTWSSLSFIAIALIILWPKSKGAPSSYNNLTRNRGLGNLYGFSCLLIGGGCFFYHASLSFVGQWFDVMGMYLTVTFFILYNIQRLKNWPSISFYLLYLLLNAGLGYILYAYPFLRRYLFGSFIIFLIGSAVYAQVKLHTLIQHKYILLAFGSFLLGFTIWILDLKKIICTPHSPIQGHAFWHLFTALSGLLLYFYYRSEKDMKKSQTR